MQTFFNRELHDLYVGDSTGNDRIVKSYLITKFMSNYPYLIQSKLKEFLENKKWREENKDRIKQFIHTVSKKPQHSFRLENRLDDFQVIDRNGEFYESYDKFYGGCDEY